jgi:transcriptional regulator NrdR family protein
VFFGCSVHKSAAAARECHLEPVRRPALEDEKDPVGRQAFLDFVLSLVCDVQRDYRLQIAVSEIGEAALANLQAVDPVNIYRKVFQCAFLKF